MVPHPAIMRQMHVGHDPIVVAQPRYTGVLHGSAIKRAKFAYRVAVTDFEARRLAGVFLVLGFGTQRDELEYPVIASDTRVARDNRMRTDAATGADFDVFADNRIGADFDVVRQLRTRMNNRCGMYGRHDQCIN
jgi:hypothetical protein